MSDKTLSLKKNVENAKSVSAVERAAKKAGKKFISVGQEKGEGLVNPVKKRPSSKKSRNYKKPMAKNKQPEMTIENALHQVLVMDLVGLDKQYKTKEEAMSVLKNIPFNKKVLVLTSKSNGSFRKQFNEDEKVSVRTEGRTSPEFVLKHDVVVRLKLM